MVSRAPVIAMLALVSTAIGAADRSGPVLDLRLSDDSDHQSQQQWSIGVNQQFDQNRAGSQGTLQAGRRILDAPEGRVSFDTLAAGGRMVFGEAAKLNARIDAYHGDEWSPTLGAFSAELVPGSRVNMELSGERDLVDTVDAVRRRIVMDTTALSADWAVTPLLTLVTAVQHSSFSDRNSRDGRTVRLIWSPSVESGFSAQIRLRRTDSEAQGIGYFNPRRIEQYVGLVRLAGSPLGEHWRMSIQAGVGEQSINKDAGSLIYEGDARIRGQLFERLGLEARLFCTNTGDLGSVSADSEYRYCQTMMSVYGSW